MPKRSERVTWNHVDKDTWESDQGYDGTPEYVITRERDGWRLKMRTSSQGVRGFVNARSAKDYAERIYENRR